MDDCLDIEAAHLTRVQSWSMGIGAHDSRQQHFDSSSQDISNSSCYCPSSSSASTNAINSNSNSPAFSTNIIAQHRINSAHENPQQYAHRESILQLEIPTAYLSRKDNNSFHVYQLRVKVHDGREWSVYRRYSQFHALHSLFKKLNSRVKKLTFPPKRRIGNKATSTVKERRRKLEVYINSLWRIIELESDAIERLNGNQPTLSSSFPDGQVVDRQVSNRRKRSSSNSSKFASTICSDYLSCINLDANSEGDDPTSSDEDNNQLNPVIMIEGDRSSTCSRSIQIPQQIVIQEDESSSSSSPMTTIEGTTSTSNSVSANNASSNNNEDDDDDELVELDLSDIKSIFYKFISYSDTNNKQQESNHQVVNQQQLDVVNEDASQPQQCETTNPTFE